MACFSISDGDLAMPSIRVRALRAGEPYHHLTAFTVRRSPYLTAGHRAFALVGGAVSHARAWVLVHSPLAVCRALRLRFQV
jgi:hypothetical protein